MNKWPDVTTRHVCVDSTSSRGGFAGKDELPLSAARQQRRASARPTEPLRERSSVRSVHGEGELYRSGWQWSAGHLRPLFFLFPVKGSQDALDSVHDRPLLHMEWTVELP